MHGFSRVYSGALAREARAAEHHEKQNLVNYPSEKIWLKRNVPTRTHTSCKPMSNFTIDLAQLDTSLSVMVSIRMNIIRLTAVKSDTR